MATGPVRTGGPAIRALDPWLPGNPSAGRSHQLLSEQERAQLATIASIVRFKKGEDIYATGDAATTIFNLISGVVKTYQKARDGSEHIVAFLYAEDLFGLSEEGRYTNAAKAVTPVTAYALPVPALRKRLVGNPELELHVIAKLCHELRQAQRHALLLAQRHAVAKLVLFLQLLEHIQSERGDNGEIYMSMDRSDIADYVGMSLAAVSRGFRALEAKRIVQIRDRRHVKILDRAEFDRLTGNGA